MKALLGQTVGGPETLAIGSRAEPVPGANVIAAVSSDEKLALATKHGAASGNVYPAARSTRPRCAACPVCSGRPARDRDPAGFQVSARELLDFYRQARSGR